MSLFVDDFELHRCKLRIYVYALRTIDFSSICGFHELQSVNIRHRSHGAAVHSGPLSRYTNVQVS